MRVLSWNLWWRHGPWQRRQESIAATLTELAPDVCGLQEVWGDSEHSFAAELADRLGMHWCWAARPPRESWQREHGSELLVGNAVLSRWPILAHTEQSLPTVDGQHRVALHARIDAPAGQLPFFTTHFSHQPGASAVRVAQARRLAAFVAAHTAADDPYPPLVSGDLNAHPSSDELRLLGGVLTAPAVPGLVLIDSWAYADPTRPGFTWDHRNPYLADDPFPDARIDYLLVGVSHTGHGRVRGVRVAGDTASDGVWPSDHFCLVADLTD